MEKQSFVEREKKNNFVNISIKDFVIDFFGKLFVSYFLAIRNAIKLSNSIEDDLLLFLFEKRLNNIIEKFLNSELWINKKKVGELKIKIKEEILFEFQNEKNKVDLEKLKLTGKALREFSTFVIENLNNILSYHNLENFKRKVYQTNEFLNNVWSFFEEVFLENFLRFYQDKSEDFFLQKEYIEKFFKNQKIILKKRIKAQAQSIGAHIYTFWWDEKVIYFGREFVFWDKSKFDYSLFLGYLLEMMNQYKWVFLVAIDLDDFKWVNTLFGHPIWDIVLGNFMRKINSFFSNNDWLWIKYWWEEFIALFKDKDDFLRFIYDFYKSSYIWLNIEDINRQNSLISDILEEINWEKADYNFVFKKGDVNLKVNIEKRGDDKYFINFFDLNKNSFIAWDLLVRLSEDKNIEEIGFWYSFTYSEKNIRKIEVNNLFKDDKADLKVFLKWIEELSSKITEMKSRKKHRWN